MLTIRAIGHDKTGPTRGLCDEYLRRCRRPARLLTHEARGDTGREVAWLGADLPPKASIVALDSRGEAWSSEELARFLTREEDGGREVIFLIGGAAGLGTAARLKTDGGPADHLLSLGRLTLPHLLARVVLCEQLYRAECIARGHPYHKG